MILSVVADHPFRKYGESGWKDAAYTDLEEPHLGSQKRDDRESTRANYHGRVPWRLIPPLARLLQAGLSLEVELVDHPRLSGSVGYPHQTACHIDCKYSLDLP